MNQNIDDNCIFCKLAHGKIPTNSIYEDDDFKVILDTSPASRGHSIILPKTHAANIFELPDEYCEKIFKVAKKCGTAIKNAFGYEGLNVLQNNGEPAGQTVFHLHVHLIPRNTDDGITIKYVPDNNMDDSIAAETAGKIKAQM